MTANNISVSRNHKGGAAFGRNRTPGPWLTLSLGSWVSFRTYDLAFTYPNLSRLPPQSFGVGGSNIFNSLDSRAPRSAKLKVFLWLLSIAGNRNWEAKWLTIPLIRLRRHQ